MHPQAHAWVATHIGNPTSVLEYGSLNINGSVRDCAPDAAWHGVDMVAGPGVDEVADAANYIGGPVDCVVCCEVLEHTPDAEAILRNAWASLNADGILLVTAACNDRAPHSAVDGGPIRAGEYYGNVDPDAFADMTRAVGFEILTTDTHRARGDYYLKAAKRHG